MLKSLRRRTTIFPPADSSALEILCSTQNGRAVLFHGPAKYAASHLPGFSQAGTHAVRQLVGVPVLSTVRRSGKHTFDRVDNLLNGDGEDTFGVRVAMALVPGARAAVDRILHVAP